LKSTHINWLKNWRTDITFCVCSWWI
jgi:hypothetical protein